MSRLFTLSLGHSRLAQLAILACLLWTSFLNASFSVSRKADLTKDKKVLYLFEDGKSQYTSKTDQMFRHNEQHGLFEVNAKGSPISIQYKLEDGNPATKLAASAKFISKDKVVSTTIPAPTQDELHAKDSSGNIMRMAPDGKPLSGNYKLQKMADGTTKLIPMGHDPDTSAILVRANVNVGSNLEGKSHYKPGENGLKPVDAGGKSIA